MKIDKRDPAHWLWLLLSALVVVAAGLLRWLPRRGDTEVFLYGHQLNGNLAALLAQSRRRPIPGVRLTFLTMDPATARRLRAAGEPACLLWSPGTAPRLARAGAIVSDHGLHVLEWLLRTTRLRFFDVWHGIPFKGFDADDFRVQHRYDEAWVASPLLAAMYVDRFGFAPERVHATGYARTDALVAPVEDVEAVRERLGLQRIAGRRTVLFAPTWRQDAAGRSIFPFDVPAERFLAALSEACARVDAVVLFRAHLNTPGGEAAAGDRVVAVPQADYPDTEAILRLADVLVCDWSSIAFDYLLLDRPTIFLDVPAPFAKGFSLGPEYRFGELVDSLPALVAALATALRDPADWRARHRERIGEIRTRVYGDCADGRAAERCLARLAAALATGGSSR